MKTLSLMLYYKIKENFLPTKLDSSPCLVLNADYQPLSYFPLSLWGWQDVIKAVFLERVNIVVLSRLDQYQGLFNCYFFDL